MSETISSSAAKPSRKAPSPNSRLRAALAGTAAAGAAAKTVFVFAPPPASITCASPFQATGIAGPNTVVDSAEIVVPGGTIAGAAIAPTPPFTWAFEFPDPPQDTPLALVVNATVTDPATGATTPEVTVVPFECASS